MMDDWRQDVVKGLAENQLEAVTHVDGPLLVLAGPGSGKTRVITHRICYLISQGIPAWSILALTFTNKAAGEMRQRIDRMLPDTIPGRRGLTIATFHSFCARFLRRYAAAAGLSERFTIYDSRDQREAVKKALEEAGMSAGHFTPATVLSAISHAKNCMKSADDFAAEATDFYTRSIAKVFRHYERILRARDALDFDDLLVRTARLLKADDVLRSELQERFQYLLVDEYQDTNHVQFVIAATLAASHNNICVVGDPDQSIYAWRGADIRNILEFEQHFHRAKVIPLGKNYRSTGHIVAAADGLIQHNRRRKHKALHTALEDGLKPQIVACRDEHHEADLVVDLLRRRRDEGIAWKSMAVLYRVNALSRVMEEHLRNAQIPYVIAQGTAFYERKEIKDALSYLRLIINPRDEGALRRIVNTPVRGIGRTTLERIEAWAVRNNVSFIEALERVREIEGLTGRAVSAITRFIGMVSSWRSGEGGTLTPPDSLADLVERVIRESGLEGMYRRNQTEEDEERLRNLEELVSAASQFSETFDFESSAVSSETEDKPAGERSARSQREVGGEVTDFNRPAVFSGSGMNVPSALDWLAAFLESVALTSDADAIDPASGAVTLMTLHAAKGLEFDTICMIGLEQGLLPHSRAFEDERELEEERRLCFVGMTRAERFLLMTCARYRTHRGAYEKQMFSQFLQEVPEECVVVSDQSDTSTSDDWDGGHRMGRGGRADRAAYGRRAAGASRISEPDDRTSPFPIGCMVKHATFGLGRVEAIDCEARGSRATISFQTVGRKTLYLEFANLQRV